ncbi:unnamed protein product [Owenia fusiformis]|uniref:beta-N-acetylhexosaminidase n=1 Tax=Owenia fusiformis TaxID=6347 RepID=A0A8S4NQA6_OWEFU|nr:unnamed protein product [Owenia fusiformis]
MSLKKKARLFGLLIATGLVFISLFTYLSHGSKPVANIEQPIKVHLRDSGEGALLRKQHREEEQREQLKSIHDGQSDKEHETEDKQNNVKDQEGAPQQIQKPILKERKNENNVDKNEPQLKENGDDNAVNKPAQTEEQVHSDVLPKVSIRSQLLGQKRLVHLDLKGAPPNLAYFRQIFPVFKKLGANGLLIEYEDMFPYSGDLSVIAASNSYTQANIAELHKLAKENGLEIMPLVQTFGHMEFVLKHREFIHLREVQDYASALCPANKEAILLVYKMIDQMMALHPDISYLHIGCDEVYHLGMSQMSQDMMAHLRISKNDLFVRHVSTIAQYVKTKYPHVQPVMWDDMFRWMDEESLQKYKIGRLVEPMIWLYTYNVVERLEMSIWEKYAKHFPNVWAASAFKGAGGVLEYTTNIEERINNHLDWINMMNIVESRKLVNFRGIALTGWQRYDHFAGLCELLPVTIPSLGLTLAIMLHGNMNETLQKQVFRTLGCDPHMDLSIRDPPPAIYPHCSYPGNSLLSSVYQLRELHYKFDEVAHSRQSVLYGWMSPYNIKHNFSNNWQLDNMLKPMNEIKYNTMSYISSFKNNMVLIYDKPTIDEFLDEQLTWILTEIADIERKAMKLMQIRSWPKRPLGILPRPRTPNVRNRQQGGNAIQAAPNQPVSNNNPVQRKNFPKANDQSRSNFYKRRAELQKRPQFAPKS